MSFSMRAQASLEHVLLIGGAVLVAAIVIGVIVMTAQGTGEQVEEGAVQLSGCQQYTVPADCLAATECVAVRASTQETYPADATGAAQDISLIDPNDFRCVPGTVPGPGDGSLGGGDDGDGPSLSLSRSADGGTVNDITAPPGYTINNVTRRDRSIFGFKPTWNPPEDVTFPDSLVPGNEYHYEVTLTDPNRNNVLSTLDLSYMGACTYSLDISHQGNGYLALVQVTSDPAQELDYTVVFDEDNVDNTRYTGLVGDTENYLYTFSHTYSAPGSYPVHVVAQNSEGVLLTCGGPTTAEVTSGTCSYTLSVDTGPSGYYGVITPAILPAQTADYTVYFDTGNPAGTTYTGEVGAGETYNFIHDYDTAGSHAVSVYARTEDGAMVHCTGPESAEVWPGYCSYTTNVTPQENGYLATLTPTVEPGQEVTYTVVFDQSDQDNTRYTGRVMENQPWTFSHTYFEGGTYSLAVLAETDDGVTLTCEGPETENVLPNCNYAVGIGVSAVGEPAFITTTVTPDEPLDYTVIFDPVNPSTSTYTGFVGPVENYSYAFSHTYSVSGDYTPHVLAQTASGYTITCEGDGQIHVAKPIDEGDEFTVSATTVSGGQGILLDSQFPEDTTRVTYIVRRTVPVGADITSAKWRDVGFSGHTVPFTDTDVSSGNQYQYTFQFSTYTGSPPGFPYSLKAMSSDVVTIP